MRTKLKIEIPNNPAKVTKALGLIFRNSRSMDLEYNKWGVDKA